MSDRVLVYAYIDQGRLDGIWSPEPEKVRVITMDEDDQAEEEIILHKDYPVDHASQEQIEEWIARADERAKFWAERGFPHAVRIEEK